MKSRGMVEMKELKTEVPKGYEIDKEKSTFECIKFKKKKEIKTWDDLCDYSKSSDDVRVSGYCISNDSNIYMAHRLFAGSHSMNVFATEKEAKSALAMSQISQLMPYYGRAITDEEWGDTGMRKFTIVRHRNRVFFDTSFDFYRFISFRTEEQRDNFYKHNEQLVHDYLMID